MSRRVTRLALVQLPVHITISKVMQVLVEVMLPRVMRLGPVQEIKETKTTVASQPRREYASELFRSKYVTVCLVVRLRNARCPG